MVRLSWVSACRRWMKLKLMAGGGRSINRFCPVAYGHQFRIDILFQIPPD